MDRPVINLDKSFNHTSLVMPAETPAIPRFYLFGEAPKEVDHHFLHLEEIRDRSAPLHGRIRPHMHADLNHFFLILQGSGRILNDDRDLDFTGAHVLFVPAGTVHGFSFSEDIVGYVLTVSTTYLADLLRTQEYLNAPAALQALHIPDRPTRNALRQWILRLARELVWEAPAHRSAIEANLLGFVVDLHRLSHRQSQIVEAPAGPQHRLVARFRQQVEARYRESLELDAYLKALCASETQLRYACQKIGEKSPMQMILDRRMIEARRLLLYSDLSISACSQQVGFEDAAYFSRLFTRHAGLSPRAYRAGRRQIA